MAARISDFAHGIRVTSSFSNYIYGDEMEIPRIIKSKIMVGDIIEFRDIWIKIHPSHAPMYSRDKGAQWKLIEAEYEDSLWKKN